MLTCYFILNCEQLSLIYLERTIQFIDHIKFKIKFFSLKIFGNKKINFYTKIK